MFVPTVLYWKLTSLGFSLSADANVVTGTGVSTPIRIRARSPPVRDRRSVYGRLASFLSPW